MKVSIKDIKKLREETSAGISDCRAALEDADGDFKKARKLLDERGLKKAEKKSDRETSQGIIESYVHAGGKIGVLVELRCETDFVAKNSAFKDLAHELALQIAAMNPKDEQDLMKSAYIRDAGKTMEDLVKSSIATIGENITVSRFVRYDLS